MANATFHQDWLEHDGKICIVDGLKCRVKVVTGKAIYPYPHSTIEVSAVPVSKQSKKYKKIKDQLGDDWSTDLLESFETGCDVLNQLADTN